MEEKYDTALLGILQNEGKIETFLDAILGFLYRRTDFYRIMKSKNDKLGFPPGVALRMMASIHKKYEDMAAAAEKAIEKQRQQMERKKTEKNAELNKKDTTPVSETSKTTQKEKSVNVMETENKTNEKTDKSNIATTKTDLSDIKGDKVNSENINSEKVEHKTVEDSLVVKMETHELDSKMAEGDTGNEGKTKEANTDKKTKTAIDPRTGKEDEDPELTRQQKVFQDDPESYNGARREHYRWAQSINDLDLRVNVPSHIKKGRDVKVDTNNKHVKVEFKDTSGSLVQPVNGDLTWEVHKDETVWSLVPGDHIHINFEKKEERWWEACFTDEPKINVRKIDASRPMSDLDQEAQAKIEEMMYNDRQKKLGLPQTHESKMHDMLRKAWDAEGSPFKGQEFDPSKFSVDPSGVMQMKP